ncbi:hypothetical protein H0N95_02110 [Candidatus Micrarchaeota archaeon]|nr:hypothetical protein [Candidatus Micrarchaeota archaeon]
MALISDIIKKYERQAKDNSMARNNQSYAQNRDDIFLKVEPRGDPVGEDRSAALGSGNLWKAQKIGLYTPAKIIENEPEAPSGPTLEEQLENLRKENADLKEKLSQTQVSLA